MRARRAAWGGLAFAVPALLLLGLLGHAWWSLPIAAAAAIVAAAWPVRDADLWARDWLASQRGLGYETALEGDARDDPYGLWRRSRERTLMHLRDAPRPAPDRWWLPPAMATLLLAVAIPFLPAAGLTTFSNSGGADRAATSTRSGSDDTVEAERSGGGDASGPGDAVASAPEVRDADGRRNDAPAPEARDSADGDAADRAADENGSGTSADGAGGSPVDRFLRDLDAAEEDGSNPFDPVQESPRSEGDGIPEGDAADLGGLQPSSGGTQDREFDEARATDGAGGSEPGEGSRGDASAGADEAPGEGDGQAGDESGQTNEPGGSQASNAASADRQADPGDDEGGAASADPGSDAETAAAERGEGAAPDEAALLEGGDEAGDGAAGMGGASDPRRGADSGSSGAGATGGNGDASLEALPGSPDGPASRLAGEADEGPAPTVGSVRGSGAAPEAVPEGRSVTAAEARSAERTSEEQGLPGAYREIIRRYFR